MAAPAAPASECSVALALLTAERERCDAHRAIGLHGRIDMPQSEGRTP